MLLLALTGLRIGELLALRWRNVDLGTTLLRVEETVYEGHFDEPKSKHSIRLVPLAPLACAVLAARFQKSSGDLEALVFPSRNGSVLDRRTLLARQLNQQPRKRAWGM